MTKEHQHDSRTRFTSTSTKDTSTNHASTDTKHEQEQ